MVDSRETRYDLRDTLEILELIDPHVPIREATGTTECWCRSEFLSGVYVEIS